MSVVVGVTGATGHVGGQVARLLVARGIPVRLLVRDPTRAPHLPGAEVRQVEYGRDAVPALEGLSAILMVSASESADRVAEHRAFVDDVAEAGVDHVVYTSFLGASPHATFTLARDHAATEEHVRRSGVAWTFLQDSLYLDLVPQLVGDDGALRGPAGDGRMGGVARGDVADCAAAVLADVVGAPDAVTDGRRHLRRTYRLTGPQALTFDEMAATITRVTGRPTRYERETRDEAFASRARYGAPDWQVEAWVSTYTAIAAGELDVVTDDVRTLLGRDPLTLEEVLRRQT